MHGRVSLARLLVIAVFASLLGVVGSTVGAGQASACSYDGPSAAFARTLPTIRYGSTGPVVVGAQLRLQSLGHGLVGTGWYGPNTRAAVREFQRRNGLPVDGAIGRGTWLRLVGVLGRTATSPPVMPDDGLLPGERDQVGVAYLLTALQRLGYEPRWLYGDVYGTDLQADVRHFQRRVGIRDSGIVGSRTWHALYRGVTVAGRWGC